MAKRNEHDDEDVDDESNSQLKKQRMDELAVATLPGSMELTSSGAVRNVAPQSILQSSTVLLTGHTEAIYSIAFDPTGMHLASASLDRSISEDSNLDASLMINHI
jgi:WD40 repeat protein